MSAATIKINGKSIPLYFGMECAEMQLRASLEGKTGDYSNAFQLIYFGHKNWCTMKDLPLYLTSEEVNEFVENAILDDNQSAMNEIKKLDEKWRDSVAHKYVKKKGEEAGRMVKEMEKLISENSNGLPSGSSDFPEKNIIVTPLPTSS